MRAIHFIIVLMVVTALQGSSEAAEKRAVTPPESVALGTEEQAIRRTIEDYAKGFIQKDLRLLLSLWDTRGPVSYVAVELDQPVLGIANLQSYYQGFMDSPYSIRSGDVTDLQVFVNGDTAYAFCHFNWVYVIGAGAVLKQSVRSTFVLVKRNGRWLYQHFNESILVPTGSTVSPASK